MVKRWSRHRPKGDRLGRPGGEGATWARHRPSRLGAERSRYEGDADWQRVDHHYVLRRRWPEVVVRDRLDQGAAGNHLIDAETNTSAERQRQCLWCGDDFRAREDGGQPQRFCRPSCRQAFHQALRRWSLHQWEAGQISITALRRLRAP